jgi:hypothetical protein
MELKQVTALINIAKKVADRLEVMYSKREHPVTKMVYPLYRSTTKNQSNPKYRISEQESRLVFALELEEYMCKDTMFVHYSIETPTIMKYSQFARIDKQYKDPLVHSEKENIGCSGSIDFSKFGNSHQIPFCNIEFKQGTSVLHEFEKDLIKLYAEPGEAVWFHTYNGNNKTYETIISRLSLARDNILKRYPQSKKEVLVLIVSLDPVKAGRPTLAKYKMPIKGELLEVK